MFFELIATFCAGAGMAGIALLVNRLTGKRLPGGVVPVAAGLAMLLYAVWSEMTWAERTIASLPEGIVVVKTIEETIKWKPWTYIKPQATRLATVDLANSQQNADTPGVHLVDLYFYARWQAVNRVPQLIDCTRKAHADVTDAALADPDSMAGWIVLTETDPLIQTVCKA